MDISTLDIAEYREQLLAEVGGDDAMAFRKRVIQDLTERRDRYCTSDVGGEDEPEAWGNTPKRGALAGRG